MFNVCKVRNVSYNRITSPNSPNPFSARKRPICWKLVRYIHLNPLRADMVTDLNTLSAYAWCGHSRIMGKENSDWQDVDKVLGLFGKHKGRARKQYEAFVEKGISEGKKPELTGGGLVRSAGSWQELRALRKQDIHFKSDERVLGDSHFVEDVLKIASESMNRRYRLRSAGYTFERIAERVRNIFKLSDEDLLNPGKHPNRVKARSVLTYWAVTGLGLPATEVGLKLGLGQSAASRAAQRGRKIVTEMGIRIEQNGNA